MIVTLTKDMPVKSNNAVDDPRVDSVPKGMFTDEHEDRCFETTKKTLEELRISGGADSTTMMQLLTDNPYLRKTTYQEAHVWLNKTIAKWSLTRPPPAPASTAIPIRLPCPACGQLHIDEGEWANKPHHTHACQFCGNVWRPAIVDTVGVQFLSGFKNET